MQGRLILALYLIIAVLLCSCTLPGAEASRGDPDMPDALPVARNPVDIEPVGDLDDMPLADMPEVYEGYDTKEPICMYVTVRRGPEGSDTDHSMAEVENVLKDPRGHYYSVKRAAEAIVQEGDAVGPMPGMFGYDALVPNATIRVRGFSTAIIETEKSFTLSLYDAAGTWRGQRKIALIKSPFDTLRFRNKLAYELMRDIPNLMSYRTQFVRLFIKDETAGTDTAFRDYGFYTQVEVPNKRYLKNHGLDENGQLYKATMFEFQRYPEDLMLIDDPDFSASNFDFRLEVKGSEDHSKLLHMLDDVNDLLLDINDVIDEHFQRDNYLTWLAFNILTGNYDTTSQNFLLYSPSASNKWYFIHWDCDSMLSVLEDTTRQETAITRLNYRGVGNWWGVTLHQRFLKDANNRRALELKLIELKDKYFTQERIAQLAGEYRTIVDKYIFSLPDAKTLRISMTDRDMIANSLYDEIQENFRLYYDSLEYAMPFFMYETTMAPDGRFEVNWQPSYSFDNQPLYYRLVVSKYPDGKSPIIKEKDIPMPQFFYPALAPGFYYYWLYAYSDTAQEAPAFDEILFSDRVELGARCFLVTEDGKIRADYELGLAELKQYITASQEPEGEIALPGDD